MSGYYRGQNYNPRKRQRGDYYDGDNRGNREPRQSPEESFLLRLRRDLISLADPKPQYPNATTADDIDYIAKSIVSEYPRSEFMKSKVLELLYNCVLELPPKIPYFASLVVVINARKSSIGKEILDFAVGKGKELFDAREWAKAKLILRFLAGLERIVEEGVTPILSAILENVERIKEITSSRRRGDHLAWIVLLTLPYIAVTQKEPTKALDEIVDKITPYMDSRETSETSFVTPYRALPNNTSEDEEEKKKADDEKPIWGKPPNNYSSLHLLWLQTKDLKEKQWDIPFLPRPWFAFRTELESNTKPHPLPTISWEISGDDFDSLPPLQPEYYFSIFLENEKQTVPQLNNIAASLIRDVVNDTISQLVFNRKEAANLLTYLPNYFPSGLFHVPGMPVKDIPTPSATGRPKYKLEDILVDTIFANLFRLPRPLEKQVYYTSLLTEITKLVPGDLAPTLGRAIRWIHDHLDDLNGEINMRFSTWFAIHLSNFAFTYKWEEWIPDLELDDTSPKKVFIRETIEKEVRLSYPHRIETSLPENFSVVFPRRPNFEDSHAVLERFGGDETSDKLLEAIRARDEDAITEYIQSNANSNDLLVAALLLHSHQTPYSHTIPPAVIELIKKNDSPVQVVGTIMKFWQDRPSTGIVLVMKFVELEVVAPKDVMEWLVEQQDLPGWMYKSWGWEMFTVCLEKLDGRIAREEETAKEAASKTAEETKQGKNGEENGDAMQIDAKNGEANGVSARGEKAEFVRAIVDKIDSKSFSNMGKENREWVREWFRMVARMCREVTGFQNKGSWVGEEIREAGNFHLGT